MINGPCHDNVTLPHFAEGEGYQIWRVDINMTNKESPAIEKAWSSSLAVVVRLTEAQHKYLLSYELLKKG